MAVGKQYCAYIMTNTHNTVLYTGVTNNIERRTWEHKNNEGGVFTSKYKCHYLMYYEEHTDIRKAIAREKQLKKWLREWKVALIRKDNSDMRDLAENWFGKSF